MIELKIEKKYSAELKTKSRATGEELLIKNDCTLIDQQTNKLIGVYLANVIKGDGLYELFDKVKFSKSHRLSGLISESIIFGKAPRDHLKGFPCRACAFNKNYKKEYYSFVKLSELAGYLFKKNRPQEFETHIAGAKIKLTNEWFMPCGNFTSGILNKNTQLMIHTDNGNVKNCYSAMYTAKKGVNGGGLLLPEYNAVIENDNNSLFIFDGASTAHGVLPFTRQNESSSRYTMVLYCLEALGKCAKNTKEENNEFNKIRS